MLNTRKISNFFKGSKTYKNLSKKIHRLKDLCSNGSGMTQAQTPSDNMVTEHNSHIKKL